ncbi:YggS family pyridoxal phosphate-dependent enzyme [Candidatus Woesearchaeota archaeon]|nr:YggS family pyridoxal phosphate-dependent enzyme [Candidatus Woesearchaeota archaeon]
MSIKQNIKNLRENLPKNVKILAATKKRSAAQIREAIGAGINIFGENYVQEAEKKYTKIKTGNSGIRLYFIGNLQKNKINRALKLFDVINIDSYETASEISKRANKKIKVIIEVNISKEPSKHGCKTNELTALIKKLSKLENIEVKGLMAMAPYFKGAEKTRPYFKKMKLLFSKISSLKLKNINMDILSLGMSHDYKIAVQEGSNLIRVGSLIFD